MTSRKKSKQRARRAAKAAEATLVAKVEAAGLFSPVPRKLTVTNDEDARGPLFSVLRSLRIRNPNNVVSLISPLPCTHGWDHSKYTSAEHECNKFIERALELFQHVTIRSHLEVIFKDYLRKEYPKVWTDSVSLEWIAAAFMSIGTELIIQQDTNNYNNYLCVFSEFMTQYVAYGAHKSQPLIYNARIRELGWIDKRRLVSYMKKRIPCSCLDANFKALKSLPKMGLCSNDECAVGSNMLELSSMMSCGGCRKEHYCSEACQAADWNRHKGDCKIWKKWLADGGGSTRTI